MTIEEYLLKDPVEFDFSNDCTNNNDYKKLSGVKKLFEYKTNSKCKDPDICSKLLQEIYRIVWPDVVSEENAFMFIDWDKKIIASDTMTSVWSPIKKYMNQTFANEIKDFASKSKISQKSVWFYKKLYESNKNVSSRMDENEKLKNFINLSHTIGNYCPVPAKFNVTRSGYFASHDFWDLTMMKIEEYYKINTSINPMSCNFAPLMTLLHCDESLNNTYNWLEYFKKNDKGLDGWKYFVNYMIFDNYVDKEYKVLPFCENHTWSNNMIENFDVFFEAAADRIKNRGEQVVEKIKRLSNK